MVLISDTTETTESDGTDSASTTSVSTEDSEDSSAAADPPADSDGLVSRLVSFADRAATLLEPFATLLSATVQAATVYTLIKKA